MDASELSPRRFVILSSLGALAFILLASYQIEAPGLYADEVLFAPAALEVAGACEVEAPVSVHAGACFPVYLNPPYLGALKAWLYAPLFAAFDPSPGLVRWPMVVLAALTVVGWLALCRRWVSTPILVAVTALLCLDPAWAIHARIDWGPVVIAGALKLLLLLACLAWIRTGGRLPLAACVLLSVVGLYDKLSFAWVVVAFGAAFVLVHPHDVVRHVRAWRRGDWLAVLTVGFVVGVPLLEVYSYANRLDLPGADASSSLWERVLRVAALVNTTMSGDFALPWIAETTTTSSSWPVRFLCGAWCAVALIGIARPWRSESLRPRWHALLVLTVSSAALFICMVATRQVGGAHHAIVLWPLHWVIWALSIDLLVRLLRDGRVVVIAAPSALALVVASASLAVPIMARNLELGALWRGDYGFSARFDPHSLELAKLLEARGFERVMTSDWGIQPQLVLLLPADKRGTVVDRWTLFNDAAPTESIRDDLPSLGSDVGAQLAIVSFAAGRAVMPSTERNREALLSAWGLCVIRTELVPDGRGRPLYEVRTLAAGFGPCPGDERTEAKSIEE